MNDYSGYDEIELRGKKIPLKFGTNASRLFCRYRGIELHQIGEVFVKDGFAVAEMGFFAYQTAIRMKGETPTIEIDEFIDMVGDSKDAMPLLNKLLDASRLWGYTIEELVEKSKKKAP